MKKEIRKDSLEQEVPEIYSIFRNVSQYLSNNAELKRQVKKIEGELMKSRASYKKLKVVHESTLKSMQHNINEVVDEKFQKEYYQKHLMARILQESNNRMEEMEELKLADFKRKDKNARLNDELKNTNILLQDMTSSVT